MARNGIHQTRKRMIRARVDAQNIEGLESRTLLSGSGFSAWGHSNAGPAKADFSGLAGMTCHTHVKVAPRASHTPSIQGFTPTQIQHAYGFDTITGNGAGQTIAIVDAFNDPNIAADVAVFDAQFGLSPIDLTVVNQDGGSVKGLATDTGWAGEISLDVEWAHAMAPAAKILLVESNDDTLSNLLAAVTYARNVAGVSVVSMSWGGSEFRAEAKYDNVFSTPAGHQGVTFIASAGDSGSAVAEWPSSSPNVVSVGGTSLNVLDNAGTYGGETSWDGSGGGISQYENQPAYQNDAQLTGIRTAPDVSYDADPNTGFAVYDSLNDQGYVGWQEVGGTSAGAPQWASLIAIANQRRVATGNSTLDGATGTLPTLYKAYGDPTTETGYAAYTTVYNDVIDGGGARHRFGAAAAGYDTVTGLGTPQVASVVDQLVGLSKRAAERALHAAHVARKLAKLAGARGRASPGIGHVVRPDNSVPNVLGAPPADPLPAAPPTATPGTQTPGSQTPAAPAVTQNLGAVGRTESSSATRASVSPAPLFALAAPFGTQASPSGAASVGALVESRLSGLHPFAGIFATGETQSFARSLASVALAVSETTLDSSPAAYAPAIAAGAVQEVVSQSVAVANAAVAAPVAELLHLTPATAFADALAAFTDESASIPTIRRPSVSRAWAITAAVVAIDAALVGYWYSRRSAKQNRKLIPVRIQARARRGE